MVVVRLGQVLALHVRRRKRSNSVAANEIIAMAETTTTHNSFMPHDCCTRAGKGLGRSAAGAHRTGRKPPTSQTHPPHVSGCWHRTVCRKRFGNKLRKRFGNVCRARFESGDRNENKNVVPQAIAHKARSLAAVPHYQPFVANCYIWERPSTETHSTALLHALTHCTRTGQLRSVKSETQKLAEIRRDGGEPLFA